VPDQLMVVQFPHPGGEHQPRSSMMSWAPLYSRRGRALAHGRKFLRTHATYLVDDELRDGEVVLWGEWEPPSRAIKLKPRGSGFPEWLHEPYWKSSPEFPHQNTDPLVFGDRFLYTNCRQAKNSKLRRLAPGSLILFGSKEPDATPNEFVLDTVFVVVDDAAEFMIADSADLDVPAWVETVVFDALRSDLGHPPPPVPLRLYRSRPQGEQPDEPFSFVPCRPWADEERSTFARPRLRLSPRADGDPWIDPHTWRTARCLPATAVEIRALWDEIVTQVKSADLRLGVRFDAPPYKEG
jgi:hypothetical protein